MRKQIYRCQICGLKFKSASKDLSGNNPACPGCGEMDRLVTFPKGIKRIYTRHAGIFQIIPADTDFTAGSSIHFEGRKVSETGCNRIPTCCGLAVPCDAPPKYCLEHRAGRRYHNNRKLYSLPC